MSGGRSRGRLRLILVACLLAVPLGACRRGSTGGDGVERIVLVSIDTLRADHVGCYGAEGAETPALDALAAEGLRFETAISPAPLTLPSHTSLLTGRDPPQHGVRGNGYFRLGQEIPTLAEQLGGAGFATAAFVSAFVLDGRYGLGRGFGLYDDRLGMASSSGPLGAVPERRGDRTVDAALAWLKDAPDRFFLWVHLYDPHAEYQPPAPFAERFAGRPYDGEIAFADAQLGRLRAAIHERWPSGTLWWVTADHGESLGEHAEPTHSYTIYDATQHVPMIAAGPGLPRGQVFSGLVALADVAPSILELAGLPPLPGANGKSVVPVLRDANQPGRQTAWVETLATQLDLGWSPLLGVRTATHEYIRAPEPELYDLASDPHALDNRFATEPAVAAELDSLVGEHVASSLPVVLNAQPSAAERAQLEALGYLRGGARPVWERPLGQVGGFDPKRGIAELSKLDEMQQLLAHRKGAEALALYDQIDAHGFVMSMFGAVAAGMAGQHERAEQEARRALSVMQQPEAWIELGGAQLMQGKLEEARHSFERAASLDPTNSAPLIAFGLLAEREGKPEEAARYYAQARAVPVPSSEAFWRGAALAIQRGQRDEANALLAEVPQADLREPLAAQRLAAAERKAGRPELARIRVEGAIRKFPWSIELWLMKADLLDQAGDLEGALAARRQALELGPDRADTQNALAWTLARLGRDLDDAERHVEAAIERLGRLPPLLDTFATVRAAQGRFADALALADEGLATAQETARVDLLFRRAEALAGLGRREDAAEALALAQREAGSREATSSSWPESARRVQKLLDAS